MAIIKILLQEAVNNAIVVANYAMALLTPNVICAHKVGSYIKHHVELIALLKITQINYKINVINVM